MTRLTRELARLTLERRRDDAAPKPGPAAIVSEHRVDRGALLSPRWHGGVLLAQGYAARPGIYEYRNADGTITRELVRPETLARSIAGLARCPVTLDHPDEDVRADNHQALNVGDVDGDIELQDDGYIRVKIAIRRKDAQQAVTNGSQRELSPGYLARIDKTPGRHPEYGEYDAEQVDRTYNHLAIVRDARGGSRVAIRTDGPRAEMVGTIRGDTAHQEKTMINQKLLDACVRAGIDVRRIDSDDTAVQLLEAAYGQRSRVRRVDGRRRGRRDQDPLAPVDPMYTGDEDPMDPAMSPPGATGDSEQDPNLYADEEGNPVANPETGAPMTKDEVIETLRNENEQLMAQLGESANDEEVEELAPMAEDEDIDPTAEEFKADSYGRRRTDAVKLARAIVEKVRGDKIDWTRVSHDQLAAYIGAIRDAKRRDGRLPRQDGHSGGRAAGNAAWTPSESRRDSNVVRMDSIGPSDIWANQQASAYNARRNGGR